MKSTIYLIANSRGVDRITKKKAPSMHAGEVAVKLTVEIANENFRQPMAEAELVIDDRHVIQPTVEVTVELPEKDDDEFAPHELIP